MTKGEIEGLIWRTANITFIAVLLGYSAATGLFYAIYRITGWGCR